MACGAFHVTGKIEVGSEGGWNYLTVDSVARRLYISHATKVMVVDVDTQKLVGEIPDTPGVHGIEIASTLLPQAEKIRWRAKSMAKPVGSSSRCWRAHCW